MINNKNTVSRLIHYRSISNLQFKELFPFIQILKLSRSSLFYSLFTFIFLTSCASQPKEIEKPFPRFHEKQKTYQISTELDDIPLRDRISWPKVQFSFPTQTDENLYSFLAKEMTIKQAIKLFAKSYQLNILLDKDITGVIDVEFHDLPFEQAMSAILGSLGYYWEQDKNLIRVRSWQTRLLYIDYIQLIRSGAGSSEAQVSSGSSSGAGDSGGGAQAGKITIEQENKIDFWDDIEKQLKLLTSEEGRLVINRLAGTIQITDRHPRVKELTQYVDDINQAIKRQVDIEVKILEVTLNDDFSLGVNWSRLVSQGTTGNNINFNINNIVTSPVGTGSALPATIGLTATNISSTGENKLTAFISALEEQGEVQIVSQPHIRTLNNQSALIKVGTDRTFFRREQNTDTTSAGSSTTTTDVPQVVTEGIVLSITPQISRDGWVIMDISPVVTRVSSVSEVRGTAGNVESSAPNLDIRQASSLIRAFNGETVIIGGLIQTQEAQTNRGIPGLNDLPVIGAAFDGEYRSVIKKELIIFLTPTLIDSNYPKQFTGGQK